MGGGGYTEVCAYDLKFNQSNISKINKTQSKLFKKKTLKKPNN